jgi:secreted PhoX family phosphatase
MRREDTCARPAATGETFEDVLSRRVARRSFLMGAAAAAPLLVLNPFSNGSTAKAAAAMVPARGAAKVGLAFSAITLNTEDRTVVPAGYTNRPLLKWGDPILKGAPEFDIDAQTPAGQAGQFGFNCDFLAFFPRPDYSADGEKKALLTVNHEYTDPSMMFPDYDPAFPTLEQVNIELNAHGASVVEIRRKQNGWEVKKSSKLNRRITAFTEMEITGPAAGNDLLKTADDPTGRRVQGMLNNCGGGKTPWGTLLTAEENFNQYFGNRGKMSDDDPRKAIHARYGLSSGETERKWERFYKRFDVVADGGAYANEPFRFGWVVEIDPYDPDSVPKKRTAIGRFKHEAATTTVAPNGRVVVYSGDDERFESLYKFVSSGTFDASDRQANFDLLDSGTLYAARFDDDGTGEWLPLVFGQGPLVAPAFNNQGEVLINARAAAAAVGATKMDRPEDIERNPVNGKIYGAFTNNTQRGGDGRPGTDAANPRPSNKHGHIIEITENGDDPTSLRFTWDIFILAGDPANGVLSSVDGDGISNEMTYYAGYTGAGLSPLSSPDNVTFDNLGNLWIATDGLPNNLDGNDGIFAVPTEGADRGFLRQFFSGVPGCETAALEFSTQNDALFISVQHPGEGSSLDAPSSTFPDGPGNAPRPSVVVVEKVGGGVVGS